MIEVQTLTNRASENSDDELMTIDTVRLGGTFS